VQACASGYLTPVALLNRSGRELVLGMYWDFAAKQWRNPEGVEFGALHAVSIAVVDWDDDGDTDLVAGTADGEVWRWTNWGTSKKPAFAERAEELVVGGERLAIRSGHAMPVIADWDQDGRFDIVLGGDDGEVSWARNVGRAGRPEFAPRHLPIVPTEDDGEVSWARNVGRAGRPEFAPLSVLIASADGERGRSRRNASVEVADLNGDGRVDLLVGDQDHEEVVEGRTAEQDARYAELRNRFETWAEVRRVLASGDEAAKGALGDARVGEYRAYLEELRGLTPKRRSLNGVWFYARELAAGR